MQSFDFDDNFKQDITEYYEAFGNDLYIGATRSYQSDDFKKLFRLNQLSTTL